MQTGPFLFKCGSLSPAVTLTRSPKTNQLFIVSQCYIYANLIKIRQSAPEISFRKETVTPILTLTPTPTGSAPKTIYHPLPRWGDIITAYSLIFVHVYSFFPCFISISKATPQVDVNFVESAALIIIKFNLYAGNCMQLHSLPSFYKV